ncbi:Atrazine chlorohydrolase [Pigmentiphaga humi]|uniref:Atrazine chlorohydrolase n=1 Tax=Pigmentiphaga humi TaxID=2478468 RepID=A0A3P4B135_9BURK|nr:amidohydrolase family protein [Pigmentiphaga humi]VCU70007.1 Atrazine chlorohydrolase [Pigmentiphaga humi]
MQQRIGPQGRPHSLPDGGEFILRGGYVMTMSDALGDMPGADVHVRGGAIAAVGAGLAARAGGVPVVDAADMIVMPGFVDTHWHLWNCSLRALVRGDDPERGYFPVTLGVGPRFAPEDSYCSVRLGLAEGLQSGITTVQNWSHNTRSPAHADAEIAAMRAMGVRGRYAYGWGQDLPLERPMDLRDLARVQAQLAAEDGLLSAGAALRTPIANPRGIVPIDVARQEFEGVRALGLPITMHARPGIVSVLDQHGLLGPDLQLVHPQGVSPAERRRLAECGTSFSCSPTIEVLYAQAARGEIQFHELEEAGVAQSLSVDSSSASANADFFTCMRTLLWSHKQRFGAKVPLSARRLLRLATLDGARDLGLDGLVGSLDPGKRADIILVRMEDLNMAPVTDPAFSLVYSAQPANVDTVIVDGRILLRGGEFTACDPGEIMREARVSIERLAAQAA